MPTQRKIDQVADLTDLLGRASIAVGADFRGLRVQEMQQLRRKLRESDVHVRVVKNNLLKLAADQAQVPDLMRIIEGPTALVVGYDDPTVAARAVTDYAQSAPGTFAIRGAYMDGAVLTADDLRSLVSLPPRPVMIAQIAGQLQSPMATFLSLLQSPLRELTGLIQSLLSELPGLIDARARQLEETGEPQQPAAEVAQEPADEGSVEPEAEASAEEPPAEAAETATEPVAEASTAEPAANEPSEEAPAEEPAAQQEATPAEESAPQQPGEDKEE